MSANPFFTVLFLGMGYDQLSMNPRFIPAIRRVVRSMTVGAARKIVEKAMVLGTAKAIADLLVEEVSRFVTMDLTPFIREIGTSEGFSGEAVAD